MQFDASNENIGLPLAILILNDLEQGILLLITQNKIAKVCIFDVDFIGLGDTNGMTINMESDVLN